MKRLIGIAIAVGLAMVVFGCGGSSFLTESPPEVTGETSNPVSIEGSIESEAQMSDAQGVTKDVEAEGIIEGTDGAISGPSEDYKIYPWIECNATTDLYSYEVVYNVADCSYPDQCLVVTREFTDTTLSSLKFHIDGSLPDAAEADTMGCTVIMNHRIRTNRVFASDAIRINAFRYDLGNPWGEVGQALIDQIAGINFDLASELYGTGAGDHLLDSKDMLGCDGTADMGGYLNMEIDPTTDPFDVVLGAPINTSSADSFTMGISLVETDPAKPRGDLITDPNDGSSGYRCDFQTLKPLTYKFVGLTTTGVNLASDPLKECGRYCNDIAVNCDANACSEGLMASSLVAALDAEGNSLASSNALAGPALGISLQHDNIDEATVVPGNFFYTITEALPASLSDSRIAVTDIDYVNGDAWADSILGPDGIVGDDFIVYVADAWMYEGLAFEFNVVHIKNNSGDTFDNLLSFAGVAAYCSSHDFNISPIASGDEQFNIGSAANARFASTVADWASMRLYLDAVSNVGQMDYDDTFNGFGSVVSMNNVMEILSGQGIENFDEFRVEVKIDNISGFDDVVAAVPDRDAFLVNLTRASEAATPGEGYAMGIEVCDLGSGDELCAVGYQWDFSTGSWAISNGAALSVADPNGLNGSTSLVFRMDYSNSNNAADIFVSADGDNWINVNTGTIHPDAAGGAAAIVQDVNFATDVVVDMTFVSANDGISDNVLSVDYIRTMGLQNNDAGLTQFRDIWTGLLDDFNPGAGRI